MTPQDILGADEAVCGAMTSGGTESIIMALKAYRDAARAQRPDLAVPEMYAFFFFLLSFLLVLVRIVVLTRGEQKNC
jgi:hypothetical protein